MEQSEVNKIMLKNVGMAGRLISMSKSAYRRSYPNHVVLFNAAVIAMFPNKQPAHIWSGDLDLSLDEPKIKAAAEEIGAVLYVLPESACFGKVPEMDKFVYSTSGEIGDNYFKKSDITRIDGVLHFNR